MAVFCDVCFRCWKELSAAVRLQVKETSLEFEKKQRDRTLHFSEASI